MRISDAERREVAQKLREDPERIGPGYLTDGELLDVIAADVGVRASCDDFDAKLMDRLADLIDRPTCRNAADPYDGSFFECSRCGERWELICGSPADNNLGFCPRCGAEVVS